MILSPTLVDLQHEGLHFLNGKVRCISCSVKKCTSSMLHIVEINVLAKFSHVTLDSRYNFFQI